MIFLLEPTEGEILLAHVAGLAAASQAWGVEWLSDLSDSGALGHPQAENAFTIRGLHFWVPGRHRAACFQLQEKKALKKEILFEKDSDF